VLCQSELMLSCACSDSVTSSDLDELHANLPIRARYRAYESRPGDDFQREVVAPVVHEFHLLTLPVHGDGGRAFRREPQLRRIVAREIAEVKRQPGRRTSKFFWTLLSPVMSFASARSKRMTSANSAGPLDSSASSLASYDGAGTSHGLWHSLHGMRCDLRTSMDAVSRETEQEANNPH
jgi:hypothetical protein